MRYFCYKNYPILLIFKLNVPIILKQFNKIRVFIIITLNKKY